MYFSVRAQCYKLQSDVRVPDMDPANPAGGIQLFLPWKMEVGGEEHLGDAMAHGIDMSFGAFVSRNTVKGRTGGQHLHCPWSCVAWPSLDIAGICNFIMKKHLAMAVLKVTIPW